MKRKRRGKEEVRATILKYLKTQSFGRTTGQIASAVGINWDSANSYLHALYKDELLFYEKVGRQNQWCLMEYYRHWKNSLSRLKHKG